MPWQLSFSFPLDLLFWFSFDLSRELGDGFPFPLAFPVGFPPDFPVPCLDEPFFGGFPPVGLALLGGSPVNIAPIGFCREGLADGQMNIVCAPTPPSQKKGRGKRGLQVSDTRRKIARVSFRIPCLRRLYFSTSWY